jgi:hypothetical protein
MPFVGTKSAFGTKIPLLLAIPPRVSTAVTLLLLPDVNRLMYDVAFGIAGPRYQTYLANGKRTIHRSHKTPRLNV